MSTAPLNWLTTTQLTAVAERVAAFAGLRVAVSPGSPLAAALAAQIGAHAEPPEVYVQQLEQRPAEIQRLTEQLLNHETVFFRNRPHAQALREVLLPELHARRPDGTPLRIWSAGCATGEEVYTLAILAQEALGSARTVLVTGTDLSSAALSRAVAARYRGRALTYVPPPLLERYFIQEGEEYVVAPTIRQMVRFERRNLLDAPPEAPPYDLIVCQNVLIYFREAAAAKLIATFHQSLRDDGTLLLGFSEAVRQPPSGFAPKAVAGTYVYCKTAYNERQSPGPERRRKRPVARPSAQIAPTTAQTPAELVVTARQHADRGEVEAAIPLVRQAIQRDTLVEGGQLLLGSLAVRLGRWQEAVSALEQARFLDLGSPVVSFYLAWAYDQLGQRRQAVTEYRSALRKLEVYAPDAVLDGVAVGWLRASCEQQLGRMRGDG